MDIKRQRIRFMVYLLVTFAKTKGSIGDEEQKKILNILSDNDPTKKINNKNNIFLLKEYNLALQSNYHPTFLIDRFYDKSKTDSFYQQLMLYSLFEIGYCKQYITKEESDIINKTIDKFDALEVNYVGEMIEYYKELYK